MPDIAVAAVLMDTLDDGFDGIHLIRPHDHELLLAGDKHHVAAEGLPEIAFHQECLGEAVEVGDLFVRLIRELIDGQKTLIGIESEMPGVVIGKIVSAVAIAHDEKLKKAKQRFRVAVPGIVLVIDDLLHRSARIDTKGLQLDLHARHAVDENEGVVAVVAVIGVDPELIDDLKVVFAPIPDIHERVIKRRAVVTGEGVALAEKAGGSKDIRGDDLVEKP